MTPKKYPTDARLSAWIDGELPPAEQRELQQHIDRDPDLRARVDALRQVGEALRSEERPTLVSAERMWQDVQRELRTSTPQRSQTVAWKFWGAAVAALLAAALLPRVWQPPTVPALARVEFVESDLSGVSPMVYTDNEAGWTVVWLDGAVLEPNK